MHAHFRTIMQPKSIIVKESFSPLFFFRILKQDERLFILETTFEEICMKVFLLKDVEKVGCAGEMLKVKDGFAFNFLIPHGLAIIVTPENEHLFSKKIREIENRKQVIESKTSMLAERINSLKLILKRKKHDSDKLYGAVGAHEIVDLLSSEGIKVTKSQIIFNKAIKELGNFDITIKLSNSLQPKCSVKIVAE